MTNERVISYLSQMYIIQFNEKEHESLTIAINSIQENDKLKADIEQLKSELEQSVKLPNELDKGTVCYIYANSVYTVSIDNIGKAIKLRGVRYFYGNYEEAKQSLKGQV